ncbi:hypothetical protein MLD38_021440 [Melastoma candidum]|uniref:Uncharacterized protein n=1 Tax=Melastoma candidum TaxID=119954 RepID=A0ACB9QG60_9MYRT|nr:hypothetical protein MLD38_021440 [Melastoma candidum]
MSTYPILNNRPIDQWRVVDLKDELKRRKLTTRGLKEDLVKRLDEALRIEREIAEKEKEQHVDNGTAMDHMNEVSDKGELEAPTASESAAVLNNVNATIEKANDALVDINSKFETLGTAIQFEEADKSGHAEGVLKLSPVADSLGTTSVVSLSLKPLAVPSEHSAENVEAQGNDYSEVQLDKEDVEAVPKDVILESSAPINQVSEANPDLGFRVRSDSLSADSVLINENKDNIIADNIKLELDVVKPELGVETSPICLDPVGGESHPLDAAEPCEGNVAAEVKEENNAITADIKKNNKNADMVDSEKLNLDRSSGDDLMEEDVLESKHVDSKHVFGEVGEGGVKEESAPVKDENLVDIVGDANVKDIDVDKHNTSVLTEKRKIDGNESDGPAKRQCKWKSEALKGAEPKVISIPLTTPKDVPQTSAMKRNVSVCASPIHDDAPKERTVPPSQRPPTNSLRIDHFLRPFTLKAVQELLEKTGTVTSFWMDLIKTHCYVTYFSVEEAIDTRNAVYNLQWPPNGGRLLVAEFVDSQEVKARVDCPSLTAAPALDPAAPAPKPITPAVKAVSQPHQPVPRRQQQQQLPPPPPLHPRPTQARDGLPVPPPPDPEKSDPTIVTLGILFKKTKATPSIYYLPLSEEQVAAKLASRRKTMRQ